MFNIPAIPNCSPSLLGPTDHRFAFRVSRRGNEQLLPLPEQKCTIGSHPQCHIRLTGDDVAALHCVVLTGSESATVRRWSGAALLNGRPFRDAPLRVGDRLHVGDTELLFCRLDTEPNEINAATTVTPAPYSSRELARSIGRYLKQRVFKPRWQRQWKRKLVQAQDRIQSLRERLRQAKLLMRSGQQEIARLEALIQSVSSNPPATLVSTNHLVELEDLRATLNAAHLAQQQTQASHDSLSSQCDELRARERTLEQQLQELRQQRSATDDQLVAAQDRIADLETQLDQARAELSTNEETRTALASIEHELSATREQLTALESERTTWQATTQAHAEQTELLRAREQLLEQQLQELRQQRSATDEQLVAAQQRIVDLESQLDQARAQLVANEETRAALANIERELTTTREQLAVLESDQATWHATRQSLEAEIDRLRSEASSLHAAAQAVVNVPSDDQASDWKAREQAWQEQLQAAEARAHTLEMLAGSLEAELNRISQVEPARPLQAVDASATDAERTSLQQQLAELQTKLSTAENEIQLAEARWQAAQTEREQAQQLQLEQLAQQKDSLSAQLVRLEADMERLQRQLEQARETVDDRDATLGQIRVEMRQQFARWDAERRELQQAVEEARGATASSVFMEPARESISAISEVVQTTMPSDEEVSSDRENNIESENALAAGTPPNYSFSDDLLDNEPEPAAGEATLELPVASASPHVTNVCHSATFKEIMARLGKESSSTSVENDNQPSPPTADTISSEETDRVATENTPEPAVEHQPEPVIAAATPVVTRLEPVVAPSTHQTASHGSSGEDGDSIEEYMAKLLRRVRGESVAQAFSASRQPAPQNERAAPVAAPEPAPVEPEIPTPVTNEQYLPRSAAPETNVDLLALRELAMSSARQAIDLSTIRQQRQQSISDWFLVACAFTCGGILMYYSWTTATVWAAYAAFIAFGIGSLAGLRCYKSRRRPLARSAHA